MEGLLYFLFWAALIFLMMRMGCGKHVMGHGHSPQQRDGAGESAQREGLTWEPPAKDTDPVCGKAVSTVAAKPSVFEGNVYYFCSRECREVFEAAPDIYLSENPQATPQRLEQSHG